MRLSADRDDPGFVNGRIASRAKVFVDGEEQRWVITADEERRVVVQYVLDGSGRMVIDRQANAPLVQVTHGDVRIELPPDA